MRFSPPKTALHQGIYTVLALSLAAPAAAELQTGRDVKGTLWISDQGLPNGMARVSVESAEVMTLPATSSALYTGSRAMTQPTATSGNNLSSDNHNKERDRQDKATCNGIAQRYEGSRQTLSKAEQDKASGKRLIPESGLMTMRQNVATLERLKALCK